MTVTHKNICIEISLAIHEQGSVLYLDNKKAVLSQGNRAMPQLFFSV